MSRAFFFTRADVDQLDHAILIDHHCLRNARYDKVGRESTMLRAVTAS